MNSFYNPYQNNFNQNSYSQYIPKPNVLPPQQILQANGKTSIDMLQMAPNSSVLIADSTAPIVWRCISDGLGNVTSEAFDISPHKEKTEYNELENINQRLTRLEAMFNEQPFVAKPNDAEFITDKTSVSNGKKRRKSASDVEPNDAE